MTRTFDTANRLWFQEGRTAKALAAYEQAFRETPDDPVVAFQLAQVLWSFDRLEEARAMLDRAYTNRDKLDPDSQLLLDVRRTGLQGQQPERSFRELSSGQLDRDHLETHPLPPGGWETVAAAAAARGMVGLAAYALDQWGGVPIDAEEAKEFDRIYSRRSLQERAIEDMRRGPVPGESSPPVANSGGERRPAAGTRSGSAPSVRPQESVKQTSASARPAAPSLPRLPLHLTVEVMPPHSRVGTPLALRVTLSNPTGEPQVVIQRLLLNDRGLPGEVWIDLEGPPGYRNSREYQIRAGRAIPESFISLSPGNGIEKSWALESYYDLDVPGDYRIMATYHNEMAEAPDGRPMIVGAVSDSVTFTRS